MNILKNIVHGLVGTTMAIGSFFGIHPQQVQNTPVQILGAYNVSGGGTYRLQTSIGTTDTSVRLSSFKEPISNIPYTMTYLSTSIAYGTLDPQQPTKSEFISFTGITQNSDGTAILTGVTRGLARSSPFTASSTFRTTHSGQSIFILSNAPQVYNEYAAKRNNETITGGWNFPLVPSTSTNPLTFGYATSTLVGLSNNQTITGTKTFSATTTFSMGALTSYPCTDNSPLTQMCDRAYINSVATSGAPNASTIVKGIVQEATVGEVSAGSSTGSTGAKLFITPQALASSTLISNFIASSTTVIGRYDGLSDITFNTAGFSSTSNGYVSRVYIPSRITASHLSLSSEVNTKAGTTTFTLFSLDGQTKIFTASTTWPSAAGRNYQTSSFPLTTINAGLYYVVMVADSSVLIALHKYAAIAPVLDPVGYPRSVGTTTVTVGVMPTTFDPTTLATTTTAVSPLFRLDI